MNDHPCHWTTDDDLALRAHLTSLALERSTRANDRPTAERALRAIVAHRTSYDRAYSVDADNGAIVRRYVPIGSADPDPRDVVGLSTGPAVERTAPNGRTPERPMPNYVLAQSESRARRSRKGRSTYVVTRRHVRTVEACESTRLLSDAVTTRVSATDLQRAADRILAIAAGFDLTSPVTGRVIPANERTDANGRTFYAVDALVGTDMGLSWEQVVSGADPDQTGDLATSVAIHRISQRAAVAHWLGLDPSYGDRVPGDDGRTNGATRGTMARPITKRPTRYAIGGRFTARGDERPAPVTIGMVTRAVAQSSRAADAPPIPSGRRITVIALPAPSADPARSFVGNGPAMLRPLPKDRHGARAARRAAERENGAQVAAATLPDLATITGAWERAQTNGDATVRLTAGGMLTVRIGASGVATWRADHNGAHVTSTARTPRAIARRVALLAS